MSIASARRIASAVMPSFVAIVVGCSGTTDDRIKVAFVSNNAYEFWTYAERGCEKAAQEFNVKVEFRRPPQGTPQEQQEIVEKLLLLGVKGIAVSPKDAANQIGFYNDIADKVPLITQDSDLPPGSKRRCYLGTDNVGAGREAGKLVKEVMPDGGMIVVLVGSLDAQNAIERRLGLLSELAGVEKADVDQKQFGKYELVDTILGDEDKCRGDVENFLVKPPGDVNKICLVGLWAFNPPAALLAADEAKVLGKVKIVGFDEDDRTLNGIRAGYIHGTVAQRPFEIGYEAVKILAGLARGDESVLPPNGIKYIPIDVIKKDKVDDFQKRLHQLLGKPDAV